ncbi:hypothetical protein WA026_000475 [Henosepilachna vigintioctopunctata]|uniref:UBX domain-containing protein n=1 Tax=Henosepilachna vigintioctopunctata TaxID=420089 RepID=A0AAW1UXR4_9CUCU
MTSRTVNVLAPNGRRQTVKCTLNTTILQVLEEVCKKQGFNPGDYDIKHHNKALDTSMTIQFSGLPNNAQLELGPAVKTRKESEITVALNVQDGNRILGTFLPSNTLQDVLNSLYQSQEPNPVVIYMRRELYGEDLEKTDLRSLGLTGGRAMLRVIHKSPEELKTQANVSSTIPPKIVEEKPYKRVFQPIDHNDNAHTVDGEHSHIDDQKFSPTAKNVPAQLDVLKLAKERKRNEDKANTMDHKSSQEVLKPEKGRTIKKEGRPRISETIKPQTVEQVHSYELDDVNLEDFPFTGDKRGLIFPLESAESQVIEDPPDDFFNLTVEDAKTILRDIRRNKEEAEKGGPLLTAALRQLEESEKQLRKINKYSVCIIRILFPDRIVLQGVFSPTDSVKTVSEFVAEHLSNINTPFYLYSSPPKKILPEDKKLIEVDCVPRALLHFGIEDLYKTNQLSFLRDDLRNKFTTNSRASLAAMKIKHEMKRIKNQDEDAGKESPIAGCSQESDSSKATHTETDLKTEKIPKWFKAT